MNILVVDDEKEIADVIELYLKNDQYNVLKFYTGQEALDCIASTKIDLAILDIMLPDVDGFQILKQIREKYTFPVIMLTAKTEYMDKITGLTLGADDYIPKPFNPLELVARVKAQIRRYTQYNEGTKDEGDVIDFGGLFLNRQSHECTYNEVPLTLTPIEFDILWLLCENRGQVLVTALTVLVGGFLLNYVIDGIYNDSFARNFVKIMTKLQVSEPTARSLYWKLIGDNKTFFMVVGFLLLFALFFYVALSKMTKYLDQVGEGIENILSESTEPIHLITELKPIEIRLNEIKATLKRQELESVEGEKRKNDLVLFLAHDLKTPLTSIVAYLSMLDGYPKMPEEERKKYIHIALEKSNRLGELINEFFDITRYNLQNIELESVKINLTMMLEQIADELYGVLQEKKLTCDVDVEENLEVYGDPDKLARVFDNILRNAIAYCYENTKIEIQARMKNNKIEITFTNSGDRIPGDMLQTIFEKFYRVDNSRSTGTGGAGLGLAIAKEIVELHDGQIMAKSDDLHTQFIVTLPSENELEENEEGSKNEIHTHRRHTFGGRSVHWKLPKGKAGKGDMDQS